MFNEWKWSPCMDHAYDNTHNENQRFDWARIHRQHFRDRITIILHSFKWLDINCWKLMFNWLICQRVNGVSRSIITVFLFNGKILCSKYFEWMLTGRLIDMLKNDKLMFDIDTHTHITSHALIPFHTRKHSFIWTDVCLIIGAKVSVNRRAKGGKKACMGSNSNEVLGWTSEWIRRRWIRIFTFHIFKTEDRVKASETERERERHWENER